MATRPAPRYAKDPVALAKLRREKAFSSPAPKVKVKAKPMSYNRFGSNRIPNRELDTPTRVFGEVAKAVLPDPATLKRAAMDPGGTIKGAVEVASLASPIANAYRGYKFLSGDGVSVTGADMSDVEQALEVAGLYPGGKAATIPAKFGVRVAPKVGRIAEDIALSPVSMVLGSGGIGGGNMRRMARTAAQEQKRLEGLVRAPVEDLNTELRVAELTGDAEKAAEITARKIPLSEQLLGIDAELARAGQTPDVRHVPRSERVALQGLDTTGKWSVDMVSMNRDEIEQSLRNTLLGGKRRQQAAGVEPDELPDWDSQEWQDAVDNFISVADEGNLVRSKNAEGKTLNWLSLANDHFEALKNKDNPGKNTIENLVASYGRLNSAMGAKN